MDKNILNRLFLIAQGGLAIAGIIFLCISIFGDKKDNWPLCAALGCIVLSNLFNVINMYQKRNKN